MNVGSFNLNMRLKGNLNSWKKHIYFVLWLRNVKCCAFSQESLFLFYDNRYPALENTRLQGTDVQKTQIDLLTHHFNLTWIVSVIMQPPLKGFILLWENFLVQIYISFYNSSLLFCPFMFALNYTVFHISKYIEVIISIVIVYTELIACSWRLLFDCTAVTL